MQITDIDVKKLEVYGGGEHWSRYYYTFGEFTFECDGKTDTYSGHLERVKTNEELAALITKTLEATETYVRRESEKYTELGDVGAAHYMNSFGKWAPKYFIDVVNDANTQLEGKQKITGKKIGGSFLEAQKTQERINQMLSEELLERLGIKRDPGGRGRPE